jgi:hypothetical protein
MPLNPSGAISLGGPVTGQSIAVELGLSPTASISLNQTNVRTLAQVPSGTIIMPTNFYGKSNFTPTQRAIFGFGRAASPAAGVTTTNLVSNTGVVAANTPGAGTGRFALAAAGYGGDKAIFGFGASPPLPTVSYNITNLVSNTGVVAANTPGVGTARYSLAAAGYGRDKAIFGFGQNPTAFFGVTNLVSNTGAVATDTSIANSRRSGLAAAGYGGDRAIFGFGATTPPLTPATVTLNTVSLVSNTGVVASDTPGVGTTRYTLKAAGYGGDRAIFGFGLTTTQVNMTNLVSNTGVVASDTPGVGTARFNLAAAGYGGDKAIFGFGVTSPPLLARSMTNLVSNTGVVATDTPGVGTARFDLAAAGYSTT